MSSPHDDPTVDGRSGGAPRLDRSQRDIDGAQGDDRGPRDGLHLDVRARRGSFDLAVTLAAAPGEVVGVLGPNGSGKSTLLGAVAGFVPLTSGVVRVDGTTWDDGRARLPARARRVGMMTADGDLFPHLSALENVAFGLRARGMRRDAARRAATAQLAGVGMEGFANHRPRALSSGQAQRVALARALVLDPPVLLLDEPLSAIDAAGRGELRGLLAQRLSRSSAVTLLVTHDPIEALTLADRLVVLDGGRVSQIGPPDDVVRQPRSRFAARLVGLNVWRGHLDGPCLTTESGTRVIASAAPAFGAAGLNDRQPARGFAAFAPHAVSLWHERPEGSPRNTWQVRVADVEHTGTSARVHLTGEADLVAEVTLDAVSALRLAPGADAFATLKATDVTLYH